MNTGKLFGITFSPHSKKEILEKIKKDILKNEYFLHIISLNPENIVIANENEAFKTCLSQAQIQIIDGVGVAKAAQFMGLQPAERVTGVDLMSELVKLAHDMRLRVLLIGGKGKVAEKLADCYSQDYPQASFKGVEGIKDIKNVSSAEGKHQEDSLFSIVAAYRPHLVFVSFGSPEQELWIERNQPQFKGMVCMGVGGAFDFLSGRVKRAPDFIRSAGLEWLFRLINQPWRWRRQLRLVKFVLLVVKEKLSQKV